MPREIIFGNQQLLVCMDKKYMIRDIYYPHIGLENHVNGHECRIGIWVEGKFSWLHQDEWEKEILYKSESMVGESMFVNKELRLELTITDGVHHAIPAFLRRIDIVNLSSGAEAREVRLFFTHDLPIGGMDIGITAYYDPSCKAIIHYLRNRFFLFSGTGTGGTIAGFATGKTHFKDNQGTWRDAEDGVLSGNPIEQGTVDSTLQVNVNVPPRSTGTGYYWFVAGKSYEEVQALDQRIKREGVDAGIEEQEGFERAFVNKSGINFFDLPEPVISLFKKSLLIIKSQTDKGGAIIAANDSDIMQFNKDTYSYMWPRDGALVAIALDMAGYHNITRKFYNFCCDIITPGGYLMHKYNPDGTVGSSWHPWVGENDEKMLPIQEDETALLLHGLWQHYEKFRDIDFIDSIYASFITPAADFLVRFRLENGLPKPSYDLWEERYGIHAFTVASVFAGLQAAAKFARLFGNENLRSTYQQAADEIKQAFEQLMYDKERERFSRSVYISNNGTLEHDHVLDSSMFGIFEFGVLKPDDPRMERTMQALEKSLWVKTPVGGMARYENDYYQRVGEGSRDIPGNPWFICTLWLAEWYIARAGEGKNVKEDHVNRARELLNWVSKHALPTGILAEQVNPHTNEPISISPLTWSHATLVLSVMKYLKRVAELNICDSCGMKLPIFNRKE